MMSGEECLYIVECVAADYKLSTKEHAWYMAAVAAACQDMLHSFDEALTELSDNGMRAVEEALTLLEAREA